MKRLLILGAGKEQVAAIKRAQKKGIYTIALDMNPEAEGFIYADEKQIISTRDIESLCDFAINYKHRIDGVMTIASDIPHIVSRIAKKIGVKHIPVEVADITVDKYKMKEVLISKGVNVPKFKKVLSIKDLRDFIIENGFPVVIKPTDNSGARGVLIIKENTNIEEIFYESMQNSKNGILIVEKFIEGQQISTEGIVYNEKLFVTGFADRNYEKIEKFSPNIIEDGGDSPTKLNEEEKQKVEIEFEKAVKAIGIEWGPAKGDMIFSEGKAYVVEIAARLSGGNFCYDHVPLATGVDIVDIYIDMIMDEEIDMERFSAKYNNGVAQRYFFPGEGRIKEVKGIEEVLKMENIKKVDIWLKKGDIIKPQKNHTNRAGYVIAIGNTKQNAIKTAEEAVNKIKFIFEK